MKVRPIRSGAIYAWCVSLGVFFLVVPTAADESKSRLQFAAEPPAPQCNPAKIAFDQPSGCVNDGSVEFCVPKRNVWMRRLIAWFVPAAYDTQHGGGRARCDENVETLYFYPTPADDPRVCDQDAMTRRAWNDMCVLSRFRQIRRIVPTWYE